MSRRNHIPGATAAFMLALLPVRAWAQTPVVAPGDPSIDGRQVKAGITTFALVSGATGSSMDLGTYTSEITAIVMNGDSVWRIVKTVQTRLGNSTDTVVLARATLAPRSLRSMSAEGTTTVDYNGVTITGEHRDPEGSSQAIAQTLSRTAFEDGSGAVVIARLPFREGYSARVPMFSYDEGIKMNDVKVTGETTVDGVSAWTVEVSSDADVLTYAFSKADHTTLRAVMKTPGSIITMTPVKH